jgi:hypothetical protein
LAWQVAQNSRVSGLVGNAVRGAVRCWGVARWQVVQARSAWLDTAFVRSICAWHAEHARGVVGGTGCALRAHRRSTAGAAVA